MAKKIEEKYKELSEQEHILHRPGMWIGSTKEEEKDMFIYNIKTGKMEQQTINYVSAMLKVVDEIISNSVDEFRRKDNLGLTEIEVDIRKNGICKIYDNGGIPVVKHKTAGCYIPSFIFGRLRTSSNYDDTEDRSVVGTNGVGSAICNIFSKHFSVTTCDKKNKISVKWSDNMSICNESKPEKSNYHYTKTEFELDFARFNSTGYTKDFINIIHKRCIDAAAANPGLTVRFITDDFTEEWKFKTFDEYLDLYSNYINLTDKIKFSNDLCEAYIFPDSLVDIGFVNGAECSKGTHIRVLRTAINATVSDFLIKKDKLKDMSPRSVENKYSVFMNINVSNPSYSSQTKEELTSPVENFSKDKNKSFEITDKFLRQIEKSEIINLVRDWYKKKVAAEDEKTLRKINRETNKDLKRPDKFITCSSKRKHDRQLWIFEGDSAKAGFRGGRNPEIQAAYVMRGVPMNTIDATPVQIMKNEVFNDLVSIIGLKWGGDFDINNINFGKIVIASDADVDGDKIASLLLLFFNNWPALIEKEIICRSLSPIIIARKGKDCKKYYTMDEFKSDEKKLKGYSLKYAKGLGGLSNQESKEMYQNPNFLFFKKDEHADMMFRKWFSKEDSDTRKTMLSK